MLFNIQHIPLLLVTFIIFGSQLSSAQSPVGNGLEATEIAAKQFLNKMDLSDSKECEKLTFASWNFESNMTEYNKMMKAKQQLEYAKSEKRSWMKIQEWNTTWPTMTSESLKRQFKFLSILGTAALPERDLIEYNKLVTEMQSMYSTAKICEYKNPQKCDMSLEPDITRVLDKSHDYDELKHVWEQWREQSGKKMRQSYIKFVKLANKVAKLNGFDNMGDMWLFPYESDTFRDDLALLYDELKPLYEQLHAYVRRRLREEYGEDKIAKRGPIPAHLMGNMWAQTWGSIYERVIPYPGKESIDVTNNMKEQGYTPRKMFQLSDKFFQSLDLIPMPKEFWDHSILKRPNDIELICHASAWDFCNGKDYRVKQCTDVTMKDLITAHHEMGHIQYFLQYSDKPNIFRTGANPGFHEAVGDLLALSVETPKHLHKIGLLSKLEDDYEADINFLMKMALNKVVFLPFGYLMDLWRWDVFSGETNPDEMNCAWWKLRYELQGIKPPSHRTEEQFDPGAKYHIPGNVPYIRYLVSFIIQFQFHKALCMKANEYDPNDPNKPMHKCDIYQSKEAGEALAAMLKLGASKEWPDAFEAITGERKMSASVLREYFRPLEVWLREDNMKNQEYIGWEMGYDDEYCSGRSSQNHSNSILFVFVFVVTFGYFQLFK